jgi:hypothetical protein
MARVRTATEDVAMIGRAPIERALQASIEAGTMKAFYQAVDMRNPSRSYFIRFDDRLHSVKAVMTKALRETHPRARATDFHALDAVKRLKQLGGFEVDHNDETAERERQRSWVNQLARPQQQKFREGLLDLYGKCALSGCTTIPALEAAHVVPVKSLGNDKASNGILLRADLHKLFDADLIAVNPADGSVHVTTQCGSDYGDLLNGVVFKPPAGGPSLSAFAVRWRDFMAIS